jgi:hypothetical protein
LVAFIAGGGVLFWRVATRRCWEVAFDLLTQHKSPFDSELRDLGLTGVALSSFGYFLAPAIIGGIVGAAYVSSTEVSPREEKRRKDKLIRAQHEGQHRSGS